jgi:hypothetical protein
MLGFQSLVPEGRLAETRKGFPPGSPYFCDATPDFKRAHRPLDFDVITLFSLFSRSTPQRRGQLHDRVAEFVLPPLGVTREGVNQANQLMLDDWGTNAKDAPLLEPSLGISIRI